MKTTMAKTPAETKEAKPKFSCAAELPRNITPPEVVEEEKRQARAAAKAAKEAEAAAEAE